MTDTREFAGYPATHCTICGARSFAGERCKPPCINATEAVTQHLSDTREGACASSAQNPTEHDLPPTKREPLDREAIGRWLCEFAKLPADEPIADNGGTVLDWVMHYDVPALLSLVNSIPCSGSVGPSPEGDGPSREADSAREPAGGVE